MSNMSSLWAAEDMGTASRVPIWARVESQPFVPWNGLAPQRHPEEGNWPADEQEASPVMNSTDARTAAFAEGFEEGRRACEEAYAEERAALARLAESLEVLKPEPSQELGLLLAETVDRLVRQVVGEVQMDRETLLARATAAAEIVSEQTGSMRLRLHPDDMERLDGAQLDVTMVPDGHLKPGTLLLETGDGWVEDSPEVRLDRLRSALDRMGTVR